MKNLVGAIEKAEGKVSIAITASTLDQTKLVSIRESLKDLSSSFSFTSDLNHPESIKAKTVTNFAGLLTPRLNAQAPTPVKVSFRTESFCRSASHDLIVAKPSGPLVSGSERKVPMMKRAPVAEITIDPELMVPNPDDHKFNDFLESELERIKKMFLEDTTGAKSSRLPSKDKPTLFREPIKRTDLFAKEPGLLPESASRKSTAHKSRPEVRKQR